MSPALTSFQPRAGSRLATLSKLMLGALVLGAWIFGAEQVTASGRDSQDTVQTFNRDVFFINGATLRNPTTETGDEELLFNNAGAGLAVTWGEWKAASADSSVVATGGPNAETLVFIRFTGLIPNGVYSVFYGTLTPDSEHPACPGVERTLPVPSFGHSQGGPDNSAFVADGSGSATYTGRIEGDFLEPLQAFFSIVYHFNGLTYHPFPNAGEYLTHDSEFGCRSSYGDDAMRQLIIFQKF